jgi:hypothetical protein
MWKCVDAEGLTRYTNVKADAKGCKAIVLDPINSVPPPPARPQQKPANFPSVDNETQRQRDARPPQDPRTELSQEQQQLDTAKKQLAEQKDVRLGTRRTSCESKSALNRSKTK